MRRLAALALHLQSQVVLAQAEPLEPPAPPADVADPDPKDPAAPAAPAPPTAPGAASPGDEVAKAAPAPPAPAAAGPVPGQAAPEPERGEPEIEKSDAADEKKEKKKKKKGLKPPTVFGYIQVHYRHAIAAGADQNVDFGDFRVQRARIGLEGDVFPWLGYDVEVDPRAPEVRGVLRDAYFALKFIPRHELRIGQQKTQFGYENRESSTKLYAVNRTEVSDGLSRGGVTLRDIGVGLIGNVKLGGGFRIEDAITVVNGAGMNVQADDTAEKDVWGRLGGRYKDDRADLDVRLGVSGGRGDFIEGTDTPDTSDDFRHAFERQGADLEIDHEWFFISTEYVRGRDQDKSTGEITEPYGYYVNVVGKTPWQVGPIVRYDAFEDNFKRWTFGVFYGLPDEPFRVMLNYEYRRERDGVRADDKFYVWTQVRF